MFKMESEEISIFYMPHCEKEMYIRVIKDNENREDEYFIVGNSILRYIENFFLLGKEDQEGNEYLKVLNFRYYFFLIQFFYW